MPDTTYKFNESAITNLFAILKSKYKETDNNSLDFSATGGQGGSDYFSLPSGSNDAHNLTQQKIIAALNQALNGSVTYNNNDDGQYSIQASNGGGALTAAKIVAIANNLISLINSKQATLTFDSTPTQSSTNPVESGGVYTALSGKVDTTSIKDSLTANDGNPVSSIAVLAGLSGKADSFTPIHTITTSGTGIVAEDAVRSYVASELGNITGLSFYICKDKDTTTTPETPAEYSDSVVLNDISAPDGSNTSWTISAKPKIIELVITQTKSGTGTDATFTFSPAPSSLISVAVDGTVQKETIDYTYNSTTGELTFKTGHIPANNKSIVITYTTNAYTYTAATGSLVFTTAPAAIENITVKYMRIPDITKITSPSAGTFYLVPIGTGSGTGSNDAYYEYIWYNSAFELIGTTNIDLSDYIKYTDLHEISYQELASLFDAAVAVS